MTTPPEFPPEQSTSTILDAGSPLEIYKTVLTKKYADFSGRARRAEFWWFWLMNLAVVIGLRIVASILGVVSDALGSLVALLIPLYWLAVFIPSLALAVRRLHDTNKSGWWLLIGLIPFVGAIILLVFYLLDSDRGANDYGPSPKYVGESS